MEYAKEQEGSIYITQSTRQRRNNNSQDENKEYRRVHLLHERVDCIAMRIVCIMETLLMMYMELNCRLVFIIYWGCAVCLLICDCWCIN